MAIGGYFELELRKGNEYHKNAIALNTGRNALEYILRAKAYTKIYLPHYYCNVLLEPIVKHGVDYEFYQLDAFFSPVFDYSKIGDDEAFLYINYFGLCDSQVSNLAKKVSNLIVDNAQAFFSKPLKGVNTFYSPRKFFGLPDGGYLYTSKILNLNLERDYSYERCRHLLGRIDRNAEDFFGDYKRNNINLGGQPIKQMSNLTKSLLKSIDYSFNALKRNHNYLYFHNELQSSNQLAIFDDERCSPMVYPYLIDNGWRKKELLIKNNIYVATYWPNILKSCEKDSFEYNLAENTIFLPTDQRINEKEIESILNILIR